jgi:excisionase family DNA binding protein
LVTDEAVTPRQDTGGRSRDVAYFTAADVADLLQVSTKTVSRWALEDSTMPATKIGRVVRFERAALIRWLQRHQPRRSAQGQRNVGSSAV